MATKRKCVKCGARLTDDNVMKIKKEDDSWEIIPLPVCPDCFMKQLRERASRTEKKLKDGKIARF